MVMTMTQETRRSKDSSGDAHDWDSTTSWRRMYLSLSDANSRRATGVLRMAAQLAAGLATSYCGERDSFAKRQADLARQSVRCGAVYAALSHAVESLRHSKVDAPDEAICVMLRNLCPSPPEGFGSIGQNNRGSGGAPAPYIPVRHRPHMDFDG